MRHDDVRVIQVYVIGRPDASGDLPSPLHRAQATAATAAARALAARALAAPRQTKTLAGISPRAPIARPSRGAIAQLEAPPRQRCGSVVHCSRPGTAMAAVGASAAPPIRAGAAAAALRLPISGAQRPSGRSWGRPGLCWPVAHTSRLSPGGVSVPSPAPRSHQRQLRA